MYGIAPTPTRYVRGSPTIDAKIGETVSSVPIVYSIMVRIEIDCQFNKRIKDIPMTEEEGSVLNFLYFKSMQTNTVFIPT